MVVGSRPRPAGRGRPRDLPQRDHHPPGGRPPARSAGRNPERIRPDRGQHDGRARHGGQPEEHAEREQGRPRDPLEHGAHRERGQLVGGVDRRAGDAAPRHVLQEVRRGPDQRLEPDLRQGRGRHAGRRRHERRRPGAVPGRRVRTAPERGGRGARGRRAARIGHRHQEDRQQRTLDRPEQPRRRDVPDPGLGRQRLRREDLPQRRPDRRRGHAVTRPRPQLRDPDHSGARHQRPGRPTRSTRSWTRTCRPRTARTAH